MHEQMAAVGVHTPYPVVPEVVSALELREDGPRGRGLFSLITGKPGDVVLSIPLKYALMVRGDLNINKEVYHCCSFFTKHVREIDNPFFKTFTNFQFVDPLEQVT